MMEFVIRVPSLEGVTQPEMAAYIREAVQCWGGQRQPEDPLFDGCRTATVVTIAQWLRRHP